MEQALIGGITLALIVGVWLWIGRDNVRYRKLVGFTALITLVLIALGAYVRLSDAGLGCPDWPGCYGRLTPAQATAPITAAETAQPGGPVSMVKAWKEMGHRYLAMIVGALIAAIMLAAWRNRRAWNQSPLLPSVLSAAVIFQAALGAWTVTMLLKPAIVTAHLLGGITILALLTWLYVRQRGSGKLGERIISTRGLRLLSIIAALVLFAQIVLGGWVSTNYAALACTDLPLCNGQWVPKMDTANAFHIIRPLGVGPTGELLTIDALRAIHWMHRVGAVITVFVLGLFAWRLGKTSSGGKAAKMLLGLLGVQVALGLSNVWFSLPLPVAVGHNAVAAMLFALMVVIMFRLHKRA